MVFLCLLVSLLVICVGLRSLRLITWVTAQFGPVSLWRHMSSRLAKLAAQVQILHQDLQMLVALDSQKHPWNDPVIMIHSAYVNNIYLYNIYIYMCVCVYVCVYIYMCVCVDYIYIYDMMICPDICCLTPMCSWMSGWQPEELLPSVQPPLVELSQAPHHGSVDP